MLISFKDYSFELIDEFELDISVSSESLAHTPENTINNIKHHVDIQTIKQYCEAKFSTSIFELMYYLFENGSVVLRLKRDLAMIFSRVL